MASNPSRHSPPEALNVPPLNSMPYVDSVASMPVSYESNNQGGGKPTETCKPALVFLPTQPTVEEENNVLAATKNGAVLTGSAAVGTISPLLGKMNISEGDDSTYCFRVSLPGVAREDFTCDITPNGQVLIKGITTTGEKTVYKDSMKFEMITQNLCPPGPFSIQFNLPGPVDSQHFDAHFGIDGVFEGTVKKKNAAK